MSAPVLDSSRRRGSRGAERVALLSLVVVAVASVLALGGVHVSVLLVLLLTVGVGLEGVRRSRGEEVAWPLPALALLTLAAWSGLQAIPLPSGWLATVAPANADVWGRSLMPFGLTNGWASISLDPGASLVEAAKWLVYAMTFTLASSVSARRGASVGVVVVFGASVAAATVTLAHGLLGATKVYGVYTPHFTPLAWHLGPLLNPNNLAGFLNLGIFCGIGLALMRKPIVTPWLVGLGVAILVGVEVTSASRAGVLGLPLGVLLLVPLLWRSTSPRHVMRRVATGPLGLIALALLGGVVLATVAGTRAVWLELLDKNIDKLDMARWVAPLVGAHPWFGIGRGAFESVFPAYRPVPGNIVYTHAEDFAVQWAVEWGLPVATVTLVGLILLVRPARLGARRSAMAAAAWSGVVVLLLQNFVDLGLEIPALCIAACVVLGSLWGDTGRTGERAASFAMSKPTWSFGVAAMSLVAMSGAISIGAHDVAADREAVRVAYDAIDWRAPRLDPVRTGLRYAMLRHPAEPYFPLIGALVAYRAHDQPVMPWIQRALEREPLSGRTHLLLAQVLRASGALHQSLFELRLAADADTALVATTGTLASAWSSSFDDLLLAAPQGKAGAIWLDEVALRLTDSADRELRRACDVEALRRDGSLIGPRERQAGELVEQLAGGSCEDRRKCQHAIEEHARAIEAAQPRASAAPRLRAELLLAEGRPEDAESLLANACEFVDDRALCYRARVMAAARVAGAERMNAAVQQYLGAACTTMPACADAETWIGNMLKNRSEPNAALSHFVRAAGMDSSEARWTLVADSASRVGAHGEAVQALQHVLERRGGADPLLQRRIDEERAKALGTMGLP